MDLDNISSLSNLNPINNNKDLSVRNNTDRNKFQGLLEKSVKKNTDNSNHSYVKNKPIDKKLMDVCYQMESIFVGKMLREMRNTIPEEKLIDGGFAEKIFDDMLYDEYALTLSKTSNLGLAKMLYNDLS
jgi:Rod binding domain-containing protein